MTGTPFPQRVAREGLYSIAYDSVSQLILVTIAGFWSAADAKDFCGELNRFVTSLRQADHRARILVDRRGAPVQAPGVAEILGGNSLTLEAADRLALVIDSNLPAIQMRRVVRHPGIATFQSPKDAANWLARENG